ncbi:hypothetical protein [Streptomyces sp. DW26H14]|uniref:hypothetical protein n=1 Tax=Streptomyces sp. DW26H14 TaxID=3435395 RepID=UPI00403DCA9C
MLAAIAVRRHTSLRDHLAGPYAANRPDRAPGGEPTVVEKTRAEAALAALIGCATLAAVEAPAGFPDLGDQIAAAFA